MMSHIYLFSYPVDTGRKLNVHKTFRRRPGRLLYVLCMFNLRPASRGSRHDHARIRVLVNIFKDPQVRNMYFVVYFLSKEAFHRIFTTSVILIFKDEVKNYTSRMKNSRMTSLHPPFPFPIPTLRLSDTSPHEEPYD